MMLLSACNRLPVDTCLVQPYRRIQPCKICVTCFDSIIYLTFHLIYYVLFLICISILFITVNRLKTETKFGIYPDVFRGPFRWGLDAADLGYRSNKSLRAS